MGCLKLAYRTDYTALKVVQGGLYGSEKGCAGAYRFGFGGHEKDDEIKGSGNHLSFGDYGYDPRIGRRWRPDPKSTLLPHITPYVYGLNSPIRTIDEDGQFPILINGNTGSDNERASPTYWDKKNLNTISARTGYKMGASFNGSSASNSKFSGDFFFVDGNKGWGAGTRRTAGVAQAKVDAQDVWNKMKETMKDGKVTEQLQVVTHSRGSAYGEGYMAQMTVEIQKLAEKEGVGFAYDKNNIVEYSVNLAPHQSNSINYGNSGAKNVNISHVGDPLSGNDATGNVVNVESIPEEDSFDQHGNGTYNTELNSVLKTLESGVSKGGLLNAIKNVYKNYDKNRTNGDKSTVTQGGK
jgi:hypothetical protein